MKVLVFHRDNGKHLAIPTAYLAFTLISAFISVGIGMGTNWYFGAAAFMVLMFALHRDFKEHEGELRQAAHDEYRKKYIDPIYGEIAAPDEDEIDLFNEVDDEPSEIEKDVDRYIAAYNRGYKDGRKRYESEEAIETSLNEREGYADGYKDGRGHQRRKYYE